MKDSVISELSLILNAVKIVRKEWLSAIEAKSNQMQSENLFLSRTDAFHAALLHPDVQVFYERLIRLYGIIGGQSDAYSQAISIVVEGKKILKKVA